jgi:hypothetical protein
VLHCRSTEPLHSRSVHGDELTNLPIIYPDLRLDYKVATHPTFWRVRPKMGEKYGRSGDGDHHVVERILRCCGKVRIFVGTDYARKILPSCFALTRKLALWRMDPKHICATHSKILAAYLHSRSRSLNTVVR